MWSLLAPPGWRLRGSLTADVAIAGTRADPQLSGTLAADDLALRSVVDGIELQGGRLRARLEGRRLVVDEFLLHGPGAAGAGGNLMATGEGSWTAAGPQARMTVQVDRLRASNRADRQLTVSGTVEAKHDASGTVVNGNLKADQALIVLPEQTTPKLDADVVVRGAAGPVTQAQARASEQAARPAAGKLALAVELDLGDDFRIRGLGIDTRLRGNLTLSGAVDHGARVWWEPYAQRAASTAPMASGSTSSAAWCASPARSTTRRWTSWRSGPTSCSASAWRSRGEHWLPWCGSIRSRTCPKRKSSPGWWWAGLRPVAAPRPHCCSKPGWRCFPAVPAAASAGLRRRSGWTNSRSRAKAAAAVAVAVAAAAAAAATEGPSVTLGKRFGRNFYAAYERSLSGAVGTFHIFYDITRWLTVRGEAGDRTAVDLIFTFTFD